MTDIAARAADEIRAVLRTLTDFDRLKTKPLRDSVAPRRRSGGRVART
jgi:hypothetical protein